MQQSDFSELRQAVCQIVAAVPRGRATSYGAVARALGRPGWARLVGRILGSCGEARIPAHRVVDSQGRLSGSHAFPDAGTARIGGRAGRRRPDRRLEEGFLGPL